MEQLCSHWPDFHEIWYWSIFRKYVLKIQVSFKSDKNNGYFTRRHIYIYIYIYIYICVQQEEESLYQQIGLKFEEETSKMLHLEHGFVWC